MVSKICTRCKKELPITEFHKNANRKTNHSFCKACHNKAIQQVYLNKTNALNKYKENLGCKKCGDKRFYLLDFHHTNANEKTITISKALKRSLEFIMEEVKKCDVLCANCHREWHYLSEHNPDYDYNTWIGK